MFLNVINENELKVLLENEFVKVLIPLFKNDLHYLENALNAVCIFSLNDNKYYIYNISHPDIRLINVESTLNAILPKRTLIYEYRYFHKYWNIKSNFDFELNYWLEYNQNLQIKNFLTQFEIYKYKNYNSNLIPITKFVEYCNIFINTFFDFITQFKLTHITYFEVLWREIYNFECNGLSIDMSLLKDSKIPLKPICYTNYNPYTSTGRPANTYNNFNFLAINKTDKSRKIFKSRFANGYLIEFDFNGSHIRLLGNLLKIEFNCENVYTSLSKIYREIENRDVSYNETKQLTFKQLYGMDTVIDIPFFIQARNFRVNLYKLYLKAGFIKWPSGRKLHNKNLSESKVFNYFLQGYELEYFLCKIKKINELLKNKSSKLILYVYDSIVLDFCSSDSINVLKEIKNILEEDFMKVSIKGGKNYHDLIDITNKFNS